MVCFRISYKNIEMWKYLCPSARAVAIFGKTVNTVHITIVSVGTFLSNPLTPNLKNIVGTKLHSNFNDSFNLIVITLMTHIGKLFTSKPNITLL